MEQLVGKLIQHSTRQIIVIYWVNISIDKIKTEMNEVVSLVSQLQNKPNTDPVGSPEDE